MTKVAIFLYLLIPLTVCAQIFVDIDATGANNGSNWSNAYTNLNVALANAPANTSIWVAEGRYIPGPDSSYSFLIPHNLTLYGGFDGTETTLIQRDFLLNKTILTGDLLNNDTLANNREDNSVHVLYVPDSTTKFKIDGFTISQGFAGHYPTTNSNDLYGGGILNYGVIEIINCMFTGNSGATSGSAIHSENNSTFIHNCEFQENIFGRSIIAFINSAFTMDHVVFNNNTANWYPIIATTTDSIPRVCSINNSVFSNNTSNLIGVIRLTGLGLNVTIANSEFSDNYGSFVGGLDNNEDVECMVDSCTFIRNSALRFANAIYNDQGKMIVSNSKFIDNVEASSNRVWGGGIFNTGHGNIKISHCIFQGNKADYGGAIAFWGGLPPDSLSNNISHVEHCFINNNQAVFGGGISVYNNAVNINNCLITDNDASTPLGAGGGGIFSTIQPPSDSFTVYLINNTIANNSSNMGGGYYNPPYYGTSVRLMTQNTIFDNPGYENFVGAPTIHSIGGNLSSDSTLINYLTAPKDIHTTSAGFLSPGIDYHLASNSPCINTGITAGAPLTDIEGNPIIGIRDKGAYEYQQPIANDELHPDLFQGSIFPNPVNRVLTVSFALPIKERSTVFIYDIKGIEVLKSTIRSQTYFLHLDVKDLPSGSYKLMIRNENQKMVRLFIKM